MPETEPVTESPTAPPKGTSNTPEKPPESNYILKWEPIGKFDEDELFVHGRVSGKVWISPNKSVTFQSLTGEEIDEINESVKLEKDMSIAHYNTAITYQNYARSITQVGKNDLVGSIDEKIAELKKLPGPALSRISLAYIEFNGHVDDLFVGKEAIDVAKKS